MRTGIPGYRLPKKIIDSQIDFLKNVDVEILTNISVGKDLTLDDLKDQGYQSVFFAFGAQQSKELKVEGSNSDGVILGLDFLRDLNLKKEIPQVGNKVIVIGGGNVAIDVALSVARVGAKEVEIVCLEQQDKMPAFAEGINQAIEEGIKITSGYGPKRINQKKGEVTDIELARCVSVFNKKGEFSPIFDKGDTLSKNTDIIILAIGQSSDLSLLPKEIRKTGSETIEVNPITLQTSVKGVFAGGEVVSGPGSVVEAINTGKKAARAMEGYLKGKDIDSWVEPVIKVVDNPPQNGMKTKDRNTSASLALEKRNQNFDEVNSGLTREAVMKEAQRCMTCGSKAIIPYDDCMTCFQCEIECPSDAVNVHPLKEALPLALQYKDGGEINE